MQRVELPLVTICPPYSGPKHFILAPNAEHPCATGILMIVPSIGTWIKALVKKETLPTFTWAIDQRSGEITATLGNFKIF